MKYKEENGIHHRLYKILEPQIKNNIQNNTIFKRGRTLLAVGGAAIDR